ncbi:alpha/beta hydrolase [Desulforegula conservatrix]|uniref:alpha/beta hydrolase n=1 Tax=Desulforegula conservatrix TaxID=153026 RepID=UPI0012EBDDBB|nr:alpha/beta hydrolase [Desulforegula conservatrix]
MKNAQAGLKMSVLDRGYFGQPESANFSSDKSRKILISHSFGLFILPDHLLKKADMLVSISGFREFHTTGREGKFSKRLVNLMLKRFGSGSFDVTRDFRSMCSAESDEISATEDGIIKLAEDLERLSNSALDVEHLKKIPYVLLVQGTDDRIVWPERAEDLNASIPGSRLIMVDGAGHGLPFTHYEKCMEIVFDHLEMQKKGFVPVCRSD